MREMNGWTESAQCSSRQFCLNEDAQKRLSKPSLTSVFHGTNFLLLGTSTSFFVEQTQGWAVSSIFEEYAHFACPKVRLVDQRVRALSCLFMLSVFHPISCIDARVFSNAWHFCHFFLHPCSSLPSCFPSLVLGRACDQAITCTRSYTSETKGVCYSPGKFNREDSSAEPGIRSPTVVLFHALV